VQGEDTLEPTRYFIKGRTYPAADPGLQDALAQVYGSPERPRCLCVSGGIEMYIARHAEYIVKRMPDTGHLHHPTCPSFEPEPGMSGLGELAGVAIIEHAPDQVEVRTDFAMSRLPGKAVPRGEAVIDPAEVHAPRKRMSLRALLHFLYERAGFNRWYPAMEGRRNQGVLHKYLSEAARGVTVKGASLDERLYVPEPFRVELKDEIGERRRKKLALLLSPEDAVQYKMAIIVGEYNGSEPTAFGRRIVVKHMPDVPLYIETKAWERVERSYAAIPAGPRRGCAEEAARDDGRPGLRQARARLPGGHGEHDADHGSVDSPGRVARTATDRVAPARAARVHEADEVRRQIGGGFSQRLAAGQWNCADAAACDESAHGGERAVGEGEGAGRSACCVGMDDRQEHASAACPSMRTSDP
jgi:hypothetical protein